MGATESGVCVCGGGGGGGREGIKDTNGKGLVNLSNSSDDRFRFNTALGIKNSNFSNPQSLQRSILSLSYGVFSAKTSGFRLKYIRSS